MITQILLPVSDLNAAIEFYSSQLGFALKFKDGSRYAALDAGTITLALVTSEEDVTDGQMSFCVKVTDVDGKTAEIEASGGAVRRRPETGPHERRAVIDGTGGYPIVLCAKLQEE